MDFRTRWLIRCLIHRWNSVINFVICGGQVCFRAQVSVSEWTGTKAQRQWECNCLTSGIPLLSCTPFVLFHYGKKKNIFWSSVGQKYATIVHDLEKPTLTHLMSPFTNLLCFPDLFLVKLFLQYVNHVNNLYHLLLQWQIPTMIQLKG